MNYGPQLGGYPQQPANYYPQQPTTYYPQQPTTYYPQQPATYYQNPQQAQTPYYQPAQTVPYAAAGDQRYQIPAGYENYPSGSVLSYGGANYVVGADGTMSPSSGVTQAVYQPAAAQRYQVPAGYESYPAGSVLSYGGASYLVGADGTMTPYAGAVASSSPAQGATAAYAGTTASATTTQSGGGAPIPGQRYQLPAANASAAAGSIIEYAGTKYLVNNDSTMTALSAETQRGLEAGHSDSPTPGKRYQVPNDLSGSTPGAVVNYGRWKYVVNDDRTMTALSD